MSAVSTVAAGPRSPDDPERMSPQAGGRKATAIAGLVTAMVLGALDQSIVNTALPHMASDLGGLPHLSWVVTAFLLTSTIVTPLYGRLSDMYGRRPLFVVSIGLFLGASILCGVAQSMGQLIAFRALQGLGGGGLMTLAQTTIADVVRPRERGKYQGFFTATFAVSSVAGPLIGGALTTELSWRWVFYVNVPLCVLALGLLLASLPPTSRRETHQIDYVGASLICIAASAALLLFNATGSTLRWTSLGAQALAALSVAATALFVRHERRVPEPLIDLGLLARRGFTVGVLTMCAMGFAMMSAMVFLPLYFQLVLGLTPAHSGLMLLPQIVCMLATSIGGGFLSSRLGRPKPFMMAGIACEAASLAGLGLVPFENAGIPFFLADLALLGCGMGMAMPNVTLMVQNSVPRGAMGVATAAMTFLRSLGGASGVAISSGVMAAQLGLRLPNGAGRIDARALLDGRLGASLVGLESTHHEVVMAYQQAIAHSLRIGGVVMTLAFLLSLTLRGIVLSDAD